MKKNFTELYLNLSENEEWVSKANLLERYCEVNNISRPSAYRDWKESAQVFFREKKAGRHVLVKPVTFENKTKKRCIKTTTYNILLEEDSLRLKAFILETLRLYPQKFDLIQTAAIKRRKTVSVEKQIAKHEEQIKMLKKELKDNEIYNRKPKYD
jgi:hypothetical protein